MVHKVSVNVLESAACGLGIEEVHKWHESSIEDRPDDVEFPAKGADSDWGNFNDDEVA